MRMLTRLTALAALLITLALAVPVDAQTRTRTDIDAGTNTLLLGRKASALETITTDGTITIGGAAVYRVSHGGAITGVILTAGTRDGQTIVIHNVADSSITFAAVATSRVSTGTSAVIAADATMLLVWDDASTRWRPTNP